MEKGSENENLGAGILSQSTTIPDVWEGIVLPQSGDQFLEKQSAFSFVYDWADFVEIWDALPGIIIVTLAKGWTFNPCYHDSVMGFPWDGIGEMKDALAGVCIYPCRCNSCLAETAGAA